MIRDPIIARPPPELAGDGWRAFIEARPQVRWLRSRGLRHPENGVCGWCGKSLAKTLSRRWCSDKCMRAAYRAMGTLVRSDTLMANRKAKRGRLECAACGRREKIERGSYGTTISDEESFDVDHVTPISLGGDAVDPANLQVLCHPCHTAKTSRDRALVAAARRRLKFENAMRGQRRLPMGAA